MFASCVKYFGRAGAYLVLCRDYPQTPAAEDTVHFRTQRYSHDMSVYI